MATVEITNNVVEITVEGSTTTVEIAGGIGPQGAPGGSISGYTVNNSSTLKTLDADSATIDQILDFIGTFIAELQS